MTAISYLILYRSEEVSTDIILTAYSFDLLRREQALYTLQMLPLPSWRRKENYWVGSFCMNWTLANFYLN